MVAAGVARARRLPVVKVRDRRTLEVRQVFPLPPAGVSARYELDLYLYVPRSFGIGPESFRSTDFYRDGQAYLRLTSTGLSLGALHDLKHPANPAAILRKQLALLLKESAPDGETLSSLAQMLGAEIADATQREAEQIRRLLDGEDEGLPTGKSRAALIEERVASFCSDALLALGTVRRVRAKATAYRAVAPRYVFDSLAFAEEYACAIVDEELASIGQRIDGAAWLRDGSGLATRLRLRVAKTAESVNERRREQGFALPWGQSPEYYGYRLGLLKKELQRSLYLNTRSTARDPFITNAAAMVAAGLAATWATLAAIPLWTGGWTTREGIYFLALAVGAYILKDRIKEWTRVMLAKRFLRFDYNRRIVGDALRRVGLGRFSGRAYEKFRYVKDEEIPPEVHRLRVKNRTVRGVTPELEQIIHYRRIIEVEQDPDDAVPEGFGVMELFRLSVNDFIKRLDDPLDRVSFYDDGGGRFVTQDIPKVYHMNLVLQAMDHLSGQRYLTRYRVVVNRRGIVRVDPVIDKRKEASSAEAPKRRATAA